MKKILALTLVLAMLATACCLGIVASADEAVNNQITVDVDLTVSGALNDDVNEMTAAWSSGEPSGKVVNIMNDKATTSAMDASIVCKLGDAKY
ncbi:MAG: hypothetical protein IJD82_07160, partial [Clostridia bacterium]|nr:hypothetical protein [Clostridia bacterium]